jgi:heavy metal sensor kinase
VPVRARIVLFYAVIMALVLAGASILLISRLRAEGRAAIDVGLRSRASIILRDVVQEAGDVGSGTTEGVLDEAEVVVQVLDRRGRVLETTSALGPQGLLSPADIDRLDASASLERTVRINSDREAVRLLASRAPNGLIVAVGSSIEDAQEAVSMLSRLLWIGGPFVLLVTSAAVWALAGVALRPVERMRSEAEALSFGIEGRRLPVPGTSDELARLAETLNHMLARLEVAIERERRFVDDASHELRTPLAVLKTELELALRRSRTPEELEASIRSAAEEVDGLTRLTEHLLILARADRGLLPTRPSRVDLAGLVDQVRHGFEQRAASQQVELQTETSGPIWADVDPLLLRQAVTNIVENGLKHTDPGGSVRFGVWAGADGTHIRISDSGPGFDSELLPRVFEPFTQADGSRGRASGTGLGLAIVRAIAEAHGGTVAAHNRDEGGAYVEVHLPVAAAASS